MVITEVRQDGVPVEWSGSRLVGSKNYTVIAEPAASIFQVLQNLTARVKQIERGQAADRMPRLRNVVAQILLHACGKQEFRTTKSRYYRELMGRRDPGLLQLANSLGKPAQSVACAADGVLNTRNEFTHPGSVAAMDQEVSEMTELITPELEDKCPEECMFLKAYKDIKNAFPHRFS